MASVSYHIRGYLSPPFYPLSSGPNRRLYLRARYESQVSTGDDFPGSAQHRPFNTHDHLPQSLNLNEDVIHIEEIVITLIIWMCVQSYSAPRNRTGVYLIQLNRDNTTMGIHDQACPHLIRLDYHIRSKIPKIPRISMLVGCIGFGVSRGRKSAIPMCASEFCPKWGLALGTRPNEARRQKCI